MATRRGDGLNSSNSKYQHYKVPNPIFNAYVSDLITSGLASSQQQPVFVPSSNDISSTYILFLLLGPQ
jgi:hypothetical protein